MYCSDFIEKEVTIQRCNLVVLLKKRITVSPNQAPAHLKPAIGPLRNIMKSCLYEVAAHFDKQ